MTTKIDAQPSKFKQLLEHHEMSLPRRRWPALDVIVAVTVDRVNVGRERLRKGFETMMSFERLDVYQVAIDFLGRATQINQSSPKGNGDLQDQLKRAAISIPLNIAEAAGKTSPPDIRRFFSIARGSAMECGAILDVFVKLGIVNTNEATEGKALLERIVAMLTKLARPQQ